MSNSDKIWSVVAVIFSTYCIFTMIEVYKIENYKFTEQVYCGIIESKPTEEVNIKYGTRTNLLLMIDFEKIGMKAMDVSNEDYFNHKVGDRVCYSMSNISVEKNCPEVTFMQFIFAFAGVLISIVGGIYIIVLFVSAFNSYVDRL